MALVAPHLFGRILHQPARQDTRERQSPSISNLFFLTPCLKWDANGIPLADKTKFVRKMLVYSFFLLFLRVGGSGGCGVA